VAYRRFKLSEIKVGPATVAKVATVGGVPSQSVAGLATVAGQTAVLVGLEDWQAYFDERAAIREFDGELARAHAERLAQDDTVAALAPRPLDTERGRS
jgi:hypothetical protein